MTPTGSIDSYTKLYGVIGQPVRHSKSPLMLNRAFAETSIQAVYLAFEVQPSQLLHAVQAVRAMGMGGINVTIPHKVEIMAHLDEIDEHAQRIGAVNVVVNRDDRLIGYNTDGIGYTRSLQEETGIDLQGKHVLMIGAGGASRGVGYALAQAGIARLTIANRTYDKAAQLADSLQAYTRAEAIDLEAVQRALADVDVIINTTSIGMSPFIDELPVALASISAQHLVSDLIYNPRETRFLREAQKLGSHIHGGLGMFIYQGAYAFEYWTGQPAPIRAMREVVEQAMKS